MRMTMIFNAPLSGNLLLPILAYGIVAQSVMVTGSNFDYTSTTNEVDTTQRIPQQRSTRICTERCVSIGHAITTSNEETTRQLNLSFHDLQPNATHNVTVGTRGNTTILLAEEDYWQERLSVTLVTCISPLLIIIGTLGNAISVITFHHPHFRYTSTGFILTALSVVDIAVLNTFLMSYWLMSAFGIRIENLSRFSCKWWAFSSYYIHQLASWTLILLTVERTIALWFPIRCKELCSRRRIIIIWVIIAIILFAENAFIFVAFDLVPTKVGFDDNNITKVEYDCRAVNDYWSHIVYSQWAIVDAVMGDFFPFLVILIGNILTITRILKSHWERKTQMGAASPTKLMTSTTAMLIGISVMFLILNLPFDVAFLYYVNKERTSLQKEEKAIYDLACAVGILSYNSNNAFEFIVYFVSGRKFRQAFLETFLPCRKTTNQGVQGTNRKLNPERNLPQKEDKAIYDLAYCV